MIREATIGGVSIRGELGASVRGPVLSLEYLGTVGDLIAAGCLSRELFDARQRWRKGRPSRDAAGHPFRLHHAATKAQPDRWRMIRWIYDLEGATDVPGVRAIWPEGLPCKAPGAAPAPAPLMPRVHLQLVWNNPELRG